MPVSRKNVGAAVSGAEITDLTVDTADIADNAVTGAKIAAISDEGVVVSHTDGIVLSGNGGKDTFNLSNTTANVGITIGADTNLYRAAANELRTDDKLVVGANNSQSNAILSAVGSGNSLEFGHSNTAGYHSSLGAEVSSGISFLAFNAEAGTTNDTFRTRGFQGSVLQGDLAGGFKFKNIPTASADNQTAVTTLAVSSAGILAFGSAGDTNVYCSAADTLATDDDFVVNTAGKGLKWIAGNEQTTVGAFGAASVLPATPTKYLKVKDSAGTVLVVPAYASA